MKRLWLVFMLSLVMFTTGAYAQEAGDTVSSSSDAILYLNALESNKEKTDYLLHHANKFLEAEKYKDAREVAEHIVAKLDPDSAEAKDILEKSTSKEKASGMPQLNPVTLPLGAGEPVKEEIPFKTQPLEEMPLEKTPLEKE